MSKAPNEKMSGGCGWVIVIVPVIILGCFLVMTLIKGVHAVRLVGGHETVKAAVIISGMPRESSTYEFTVAGQTYHGRGGEEQAGDVIEVAYQKSDPAVNRPANGLYFDIVFGAGSLILLVGIPVFMLVAHLRDASAKRRARENDLAGSPSDPTQGRS